ncbi:MAG: fibrobacter succinogenes major paralogous domain-containing protein [Muribaculaceae bacterium]|nr:fibrobacter succinogenes major paralogous domain-containing protein [Muribaculaceae bacterium]
MTAQAPSELNGHEYVDLGLPSGTKWATCNVGADKAWDYGEYFQFGALKQDASTPFDGQSAVQPINGNAKYDVATARWGEGWQMPTKAQLDELQTKCKWSWVPMSGKKGYRVTGPNGNSIFLPAGGIYYGSEYLYLTGHAGVYWSSTPSGEYVAYNLYCGQELDEMDETYGRPTHYVTDMNGTMNFRMTVRPVVK